MPKVYNDSSSQISLCNFYCEPLATLSHIYLLVVRDSVYKSNICCIGPKLAHPDSLAAPAVRPKLGRPATSSSSKLQSSTEETPRPANRFPQPPAESSSSPSTANKQAAGQVNGTSPGASHATSILPERVLASEADTGSANEEFQGVITGPPPAQAFSRPVRSTRNPNPSYVDSFWLASAISQAPAIAG